MYSNMKYYKNICNCLRVIQQYINRKLKSANCWQRTSLIQYEDSSRCILDILLFKIIEILYLEIKMKYENKDKIFYSFDKLYTIHQQVHIDQHAYRFILIIVLLWVVVVFFLAINLLTVYNY